MSSLKRFFGSPFPKRKTRNSSYPLKPSDSDGSSSPITIPTVTTSTRDQHAKEEEDFELLNGGVFESELRGQEDKEDFRNVAMSLTFKDTRDNVRGNILDGIADDECNEYKELTADDDFKNTVMPSTSEEIDVPPKILAPPDENLQRNSIEKMDYVRKTEVISNAENENSSVHTPSSRKRINDEDEEENESPINSVVFEKHIDTGYSLSTEKLRSQINMSPLMSPCSATDERDEFAFDDYRSTISGLTEVTNHFKERRIVPPPSPTHSTASAAAVTKKMEDFLKTETEAIRQILSEVEAGDDESTVVEESMRGANEAERMAREMEREMELLVKGNQEQSKEDREAFSIHKEDDLSKAFDTPESNQFLTDIRSVIHPSPEASIDCTFNSDNQSLVSSMSLASHRSPHSPRRDLFRKRASLYKLRQQKKQRLKLRKKKLKKCFKFVLRAILLTLVLSSAAFVVNWKWNFPRQSFSNARKSTMTQLGKHTIIKPETRAKLKAIAFNTTRATQNFMGSQVKDFAATFAEAKDLMVLEMKERSSYIVDGIQYCTPIVTELTKTHVMHGLKATSTFAQGIGTYLWTFDRKVSVWEEFQSTKQYIKDRFEYAFTDRAAREKRIEEERKLQEILEAAAAAAAKEAAEKQQQLWTQTMFAGACAFVGSVATNYIWAAL